VTASYDKSAAVVVLPSVGGRLRDASLRSWLSRADLVCANEPLELLSVVLGELGMPSPEQGHAALRMWGQTGDRPAAWIAGADPVYLEPRLDSLCLHALRREDLPLEDTRPLIDHLQQALAVESDIGFARVGGCAYLSAQAPMLTANLPAYVIDRQDPGEYLPTGEGSADHRRLTSEIEMALHEHEVNLERTSRGVQPVNGLWIWGGGYAPEQVTEACPPLYTDDPLLTGYWLSKTGVADMWPGSIDACIEQSVAGFVAVTPNYENDDDVLESCLNELRLALNSRRLSKLILIFRDGIFADVRRSQAVRIWRHVNALIDGSDGREK
jgi:hypothetical protein